MPEGKEEDREEDKELGSHMRGIRVWLLRKLRR
jgi:hypothetical protein